MMKNLVEGDLSGEILDFVLSPSSVASLLGLA
jgi:hypothetical protein